MQNILFFEYKQALMQEITYIQEIECVQPLRFRTPAWENDPPPWEMAPWELVWPPWELKVVDPAMEND